MCALDAVSVRLLDPRHLLETWQDSLLAVGLDHHRKRRKMALQSAHMDIGHMTGLDAV